MCINDMTQAHDTVLLISNILSTYLPFGAILLGNVLIVYKLVVAKKKRYELTNLIILRNEDKFILYLRHTYILKNIVSWFCYESTVQVICTNTIYM